jgi:hypothetical protein
MLFTKGRLQPWETVLVFGIGGGVSLAALQLARQVGARVIVTSRDAAKLERARPLGADGVIDGSTRGHVAKAVLALTGGRGVDLVIENVGEAVWSAALKSLVRGGRLVTCGATSGDQPPADLRRLFIRQLQVIGSTYGDFKEFADLLQFVQRTGLKPVIDSDLRHGRCARGSRPARLGPPVRQSGPAHCGRLNRSPQSPQVRRPADGHASFKPRPPRPGPGPARNRSGCGWPGPGSGRACAAGTSGCQTGSAASRPGR